MSAACSTVSTILDPYEEHLDVQGDVQRRFHSIMYFPNGTALHYPGYVVALEKSPQELIGGPRVNTDALGLFHADAPYFKKEVVVKKDLTTTGKLTAFQSENPKAIFISHITKYSTHTTAGYSATEHCFLYNAYVASDLVFGLKTDLSKVNAWHACAKSSVNLADKVAKSDEVSGTSRLNSNATKVVALSTSTTGLYGNSIYAMDALGTALRQDLASGAYTHIIVIVMGWNTAQDEAVRNFNDIAGNLLEAAYEKQQGSTVETHPKTTTALATQPRSTEEALSVFRPLVIGVTWPSYWSTSFTNVVSYVDKANDADQIGLTWLNELLNRTIRDSVIAAQPPITPRVVAIGHSFGARAVMRAVFSSPALNGEPGERPNSYVDLAVGLEGAVSINRFVPALSEEGAPYRDYSTLRTQLVLTASKYDTAAGGPVFWYAPSGSMNSYRKGCSPDTDGYKGLFICKVASDKSASGGRFAIQPLHSDDKAESVAGQRRVVYIDASDGITQFNTPDTGGGAHSDIYRLPMGRLVWGLITQYAPMHQQSAGAPDPNVRAGNNVAKEASSSPQR